MNEGAPEEETSPEPEVEITQEYLLGLDYKGFVATLARNPEDIQQDLTLNKIDMLHGSTGIASELLELMQAKQHLDGVNLIEEGGDLLFYFQLVCNAVYTSQFADHDLPFGEMLPPAHVHTPDMSIEALIDALCREAEPVVDKVKRHVFYSKELEVQILLQGLANVFELIKRLAFAVGSFKMEAVEQANRRKLVKRFPEGFSTERAVNRDTDAEREELEAATTA